MRAHTTTTTKLALLLSLLALGALGLVACGGGDDNETTAASETETTDDPTTDDALAADSKSCGAVLRWRLAVVERGISCREARRVVRGVAYGGVGAPRVPDGWICYGGDQPVECFGEAGERIRAPVRQAVLRRLEAAEARTEAKLSREQVQELKRAANDWASLFATNACNRYMGQPICERLHCVRQGVTPIENCTPVSAAFQKSFADATVEDIKSERIGLVGHTDRRLYEDEAAVKFSNGEVVVFGAFRGPEPAAGSCAAGSELRCVWNIAEPDKNRRFLDAAAPRE